MYILVIECSFLLVSWPMYFSGSRTLQILRKPFILSDDESESPAWRGPRGFTPKKCLVQRCRSDGSQFLSSGIGMGLDFCHLVYGWVAISAIRYKDKYRFSNSGIIIGIWSCSNHDHPTLLLFVTPFMPRYFNVKDHQLFKNKFTYSWSLVGILMGLTIALKQGIKVIRILELQRHPLP